MSYAKARNIIARYPDAEERYELLEDLQYVAEVVNGLGDRVREERTKLALTQGALAEQLGLHLQTIHWLEKGERTIDKDTLDRVLCWLDKRQTLGGID